MCQLCTEELDGTHGVSPVPHHSPLSLRPCVTQGDGIGFHGESSNDMGQCGRPQIGQSAREVCFAGEQGSACSGDPRQGRGHATFGFTMPTTRRLLLPSRKAAR